jgi:hypothetical protein
MDVAESLNYKDRNMSNEISEVSTRTWWGGGAFPLLDLYINKLLINAVTLSFCKRLL